MKEHIDLESFICKNCNNSVEVDVHLDENGERVWDEKDMVCNLCGSTDLE